jgi:hypothetical protein
LRGIAPPVPTGPISTKMLEPEKLLKGGGFPNAGSFSEVLFLTVTLCRFAGATIDPHGTPSGRSVSLLVLVNKESYSLARTRNERSVDRMKSIRNGATEAAITRAADCRIVAYAREG